MFIIVTYLTQSLSLWSRGATRKSQKLPGNSDALILDFTCILRQPRDFRRAGILNRHWTFTFCKLVVRGRKWILIALPKPMSTKLRKLPASRSFRLEVFLEVKAAHLLNRLRGKFEDFDRVRVLDVGCGVGLTDQLLKAHLPHLVGVDISSKSLDLARLRNPEIAYYHSADDKLPFVGASFDVVFAMCVWHHVPPDMWTTFLSELSRVLVNKGLLLVYEHNPWNPLTRLVVSRCAFDEDAVLVSPFQAARKVRQAGFGEINTDYLLFLPFKSRIIHRFEAAVFRKIPVGAQYALCATRL